jgi:O-antigen ligase
MLFSGSMVVLPGFVQYFFYPSLRNLYYLGWDEHLYRLFSSFLDPNFVGAFLAIFFIYTVNFTRGYLKKKEKLKILGMGMLSTLTLVALYLTYSRSALIMLIVSVVVYLYLINKKKFIVLILFLVLLSVFILPKSFQTEGTNFLRATSSEARVQTLQESLKVIQKSPVYGIGFNAYRYSENQLGLISGPNWEVSHGGAGSDNSFLFVLATTGVIGFIAYLYLLFKIFSLRNNNLKGGNQFRIVLISSLAGLIVNSLFINSLFYVFILEWIWILAAFTESN